tara:strand:- start:4485 stop:5348 length:864 start_codon:yes stop_codon:yes gene_type:complete
MTNFVTKLILILSDIKMHHTLFALPFAIMSAFIAAEGFPEVKALNWILVCMVGARSAAMTFNRIVDTKFDRLNPRTKSRPLADGSADPKTYWIFLALSSILFVFSSFMLNKLAFYLSPVALAIVFFYSFTKRFTSLSHVFLGFALSVAPVGAWVAICEKISFVSLTLGAAVVFWLIGFDIIYSCQDVESDIQNHLHSIPRKLGVARALKIAAGAHVLMILFLLILSVVPLLGSLYLGSVLIVGGLLIYEHSLIKANDLSKVNIAFFNVNGCISIFLMVIVIADCVWI